MSSPDILNNNSDNNNNSNDLNDTASVSETASDPEIEEHPLTEEEKKLLLEFRSELSTRIAEYLANKDNSEWLKENKIIHCAHWTKGNEKFQNLPDDEHVFGTDSGYLGENKPWKKGLSCLQTPYPDWLLIRYLHARDNKVSAAVDMFLKMCIWRDCYGTNELSSFLSQPYRRMYRYYVSNSFVHRDQYHRTVYWEKSGQIEPYAFSSAVTDEQVMLTHVWMQEWQCQLLQARSEELKKRIDKTVFIIDLQGLGLGHRKLAKFFTLITQVDADCYPEIMGETIIINAPRIFGMIWSLVSPLLPKVTANKIKIYTSNYQPHLNNCLGSEYVPIEYGGTNKIGLVPKYDSIWEHEPHSDKFNAEVAKLVVEKELEEWRLKNGFVPEEQKTQ